MCVIVAFVPYSAQMQTLRKIDIAENVEEIKLICILASINNCPIYNQPEFCHHEASGLATISVFPLGVRNMGAFPYGKRFARTKKAQICVKIHRSEVSFKSR